ncbi:gas vesicle protein GvpJ [Nocardia sp. CDC186]|uniref:Gas vesicle protein A n=1 Tax=Nocardia implantans TaxID=3108168 RepID=A0ABU6B350_9NOCA|nr:MULTISPECIES: gas vesicle protein GvpJ [Nocardia]MBF6078876.1 gas vesicle structural protein GvpA [Nocardia beijingensis]MBF6194819.1 gas vesicle structural protein GvpA [Nocardia beijingensis]MEA3530523.1 gas vesicle protein GvpJ [Nocardia sp. CDC192]MEB3514203.1 gas vesicle protein GvpJ [Nocardia sp. CDC186]
MTIEPAGGGGGGGAGTMARPNSSSLADVIDTILDKGLVIDAFARVSLVGIELLTIDARVVVASVDTYLRFAEAVNRLEISTQPKGLTDLVGEGTQGLAKHKTQGALEAAGEKVMDFLGDVQDKRQTANRPKRREG